MKKVILAIEMMWLLLGTIVLAINLEAQLKAAPKHLRAPSTAMPLNQFADCPPTCFVLSSSAPTQSPGPGGGPWFGLKFSGEIVQQTKVVTVVWSIPVNGKVERFVERLKLSLKDQVLVPSREVVNPIRGVASGSTVNVSLYVSGTRLNGSFSVTEGKISAPKESQLLVVAPVPTAASSR